jgi:hypothetical protein
VRNCALAHLIGHTELIDDRADAVSGQFLGSTLSRR